MYSPKHKVFLIVMGLYSLSAVISGAIHCHNWDASGFCVVFWPLGFFTWDDAMVLGTFFFIGTYVLLVKENPIRTGLFFSGYATLRMLIEAFYNLNAQFSPVARPWEAPLPDVAAKLHLKLVELFVVAQISYTALCVTAGLIFLSYVRRYLKE